MRPQPEPRSPKQIPSAPPDCAASNAGPRLVTYRGPGENSLIFSLMRKALLWPAGILGALVLITGLPFAFIDEPLRAYIERQLNSRVVGYSFRIGSLDFHPIGFSVDLEHVTMFQSEHPDPPVAEIPKWHASIHWRELLTGHLVSDHSIDRPTLHITRSQVKKEAQDDVPVEERGWQEAVLAIYPLKINEFKITDAEIFYLDSSHAKPLHFSRLNFKAGNIRNIESQDGVYPSDVHLDGHVFENGRLTINGSADFLAQRHMGVNADLQLERINLEDLVSVAGRYQVNVRQGTLSTKGHVEYSPSMKVVKLTTLRVQGARLDYVHTGKSNQAGKQAVKRTVRAVEKVSNRPGLLLRVDQGMIENSEFGFVNKATKPAYRVFLDGMDIYLENFSNQLSEGTAVVRLRGMFMGNGPMQANGIFRPETKSPDFDLDIRIIKAQVKSLNNILRAYGDFDVTFGQFSLYSEFKVKNGTIQGYVKPLFKNLDVYDPAQDKDKGVMKKMYEGLIGGLSDLLKNSPRKEVATKADVSGPVENPRASTWEVVVRLIQNAFFESILPGFERKREKA